MSVKFDILTLFPEMIEGIVSSSILKRAIEKQIIEINIINFRNYSTHKHLTVDDYAYGGGAGMLISVEPIHLAMKDIADFENAYKILTSPSGVLLNQKKVETLRKYNHFIIICGHYEGIDARILEYVDEEISIGDYVLTGGEIPACALVDAISRLIPGVISDESTIYDNKKVPEILLSGHHANIEKWKRYQALKKTYKQRPDLLEKYTLSQQDIKMLEEIKNEKN